MQLSNTLQELFNADRQADHTESVLLRTDNQEALIEQLWQATHDAKALADASETTRRLRRLADLCAQVPGPKMADTLLYILDAEDPGVRVVAGEAILDVGYERYAEIARAVERWLEHNESGHALKELPFIIAEIGEASAPKLISKFLNKEDTEIIAAGIEALASLEDADLPKILAPFLEDTRTVSIDDENESFSTSLAELAKEALGI